jgi:hypothetical protein
LNEHPLTLGRELLDVYASCKDTHDVIAAQNDWLAMLQKEAKEKEVRRDRVMRDLYAEDSEEGSESDEEVCIL